MFQIAIHAISVIKRHSAENLSKEFRVLGKKIAQSRLDEFGTAKCERAPDPSGSYEPEMTMSKLPFPIRVDWCLIAVDNVGRFLIMGNESANKPPLENLDA
jgi:hypothetical protein